ncbi:MAG: PDZ domain-containing protein [Thermogutta sp.]
MHIREETHYNLKLLHVIFAASVLLLLAVTIVWIVLDTRRPWKRYQAKAADLLEHLSRATEASGRSPSSVAAGYAGGELDRASLPSWDGVPSLRGIAISGFERDDAVQNRTAIDRCITCHVLIDWSNWESAAPPHAHRDSALRSLQESLSNGLWEIPTVAVNLRERVVSSPADLHLWLPLVPQTLDGRTTANSESAGCLGGVPPHAVPAATSPPPTNPSWERWGLLVTKPAASRIAGAMVVETAPRSPAAYAGLRPGDIITAVGDAAIREAAELAPALEELFQRGGGGLPSEWLQRREFPTAAAPQRRVPFVRLTVKRGRPHPLAGHPRPDLYISADSPHPLEKFGCTICHEGQGPATDFVHAAHFPNSAAQARRWHAEYSWHLEDSARYPMTSGAFLQRSCLACHPRVFDLTETADLLRPAADSLLEGRRAFERYGCYGCHDVTGPDASHPGDPDLVREPPYRGAASQLLTIDTLPPTVRQAAMDYLTGSDDRLRQALAAALAAWLASASPDLKPPTGTGLARPQGNSPEKQEERFARAEAERLLRVLTTERRGDMLPPRGPSLRYVAHRRDLAYVAEYIADPTARRSDARMPRLFGLLEHVSPRHRELLDSYEGVEIAGMAAYLFSLRPPHPAITSMAGGTGRSQSDGRTPESAEITANAEGTSTSPPGFVSDKAQVGWGKRLFETQGCLACHRHPDFPAGKSAFGPDLAGLSSRWIPTATSSASDGSRPLSPTEAKDRLAAWLDNPRAFNPETRMPRPQFRSFHRFLDPGDAGEPSGNAADAVPADELSGRLGDAWDPSAFTDSLATGIRRQAILRALSAYLLSGTESAKSSGEAANPSRPWASPSDTAIDAVFREYVEKQVPPELLAEVLAYGLPAHAWDSVSPAAWADLRAIQGPLNRDKKLQYIGRRALRRHGCHGCHDIPGLEDAAPIGPPLTDWGSKQPSQLAFDHITEYLRETPAGREDSLALAKHDGLPLLMLATKQREGWLYQKLLSPRSYDYRLDEAKGFTERLRMGQWPFSEEERMALVTFVTGFRRPTIPPNLRPAAGTKADILARGRALVERLGCDQCHVLHHETWRIECEPKTLLQWRGDPESGGFATSQVPTNADFAFDRRGLLTLDLVGSPQRDPAGEILMAEDDWERPLYFFRLRRPARIEGSLWPVDGVAVPIAAPQITAKSPPTGGAFADLLYPVVMGLAKAKGTTVGENEAWGWTPPSLAHIGAAVRGDWLRRYLLAPYPIRPNVPLAMPRYDLTDEQIETLAGYLQTIAKAPNERTPPRAARLDEIARKRTARPDVMEEAFRVLTDRTTYCGKCHTLDGRPVPGASSITAAPRLDAAADRLRPEYLRAWLSNPRAILPYTAMPALFPADGTPLDRSIMDASSREQLEAVLDLLAVLPDYLAAQGLARIPADKPSP